MIMQNILLCDNSNFTSNDINNYEKIYLIDSEIVHSKITNISLPKYFMRAHKMARNINKEMLRESKIQSNLNISLLKAVDTIIFNNSRIIEIIKDIQINAKITIKVNNTHNLNYFMDMLNFETSNINIYEICKVKRKLSLFKSIVKICLLLVNSIKIKKQTDENIFFMYNDNIAFEFAKPYLKNCITYPFFSPGLNYTTKKYNIDKYIKNKFISPSILFHGLKSFIDNRTVINLSNLPKNIKLLYLDQLLELEINSMMLLSLKIKFKNLKNIIGLFDTYAPIDYITYKLNKYQKIRTICIPHGINFKYKVNYISYGTNIYTFWSKNHFERMESSNLVDDKKVEKIITGNVVYKNTLMQLKSKKIKAKNILVVGEYFSQDNYYSSAFNYNATKIFFDILSKFVKDNNCKLTIRTRLNDDYSKLAKKYLSYNILFSSPSKSMIDEINENDLIISVFSNALHEALLLEKEVLQVNLLDIENYRDLAQDNLVYYADSKKLLTQKLEEWYHNKLPEIDYSKHLKIYSNNGLFLKINLKV